MSETLRPCPFCGGKPELISGAPGCHFVMCSECNASSDDMSKERAVAAWNLREPDKPDPREIDIRVEERPDGGIRVYSDALPGLVLSGAHKKEVAEHIVLAIRALREPEAAASPVPDVPGETGRNSPSLADAPDPRDELIASLVEALKPFAAIADELNPSLDDNYHNTMAWASPRVGDLRRARSLVAKVEGTDGK